MSGCTTLVGSLIMHLDLDIEPSRPTPDREPERPREPERRGHRREVDAREPRRAFTERVDGVVRDVAAFRAVAFTDLVTQQFDGHLYAARKGIAQAEREGWIERRPATGPKGGSFTVMVATPAGAHRATRLWARAGREDQRVLSGAVKASDLQHECAVYRAACDAAARIEAAGGRVARVRVDAELKGAVAARAERARQAEGREAAEAERRRAATELELPMEDGKVLFPDAQIEYVTAAGRAGRCSVEVASPHYASSTIRSKAAAGFQLYAASGRAAAFVRRALSVSSPGGGGSRRGGGRGGHREIEVFEI